MPRQLPISRELIRNELLIIAVGLVVVGAIDLFSDRLRTGLEMTVVIVLFSAAFVGFLEALAALRGLKRPPRPRGPLPPTTAIVAAYLPNEQDIIVETVLHHLRSGPADLQVIVAYNTPRHLDVEDELRAIAAANPRLQLLRVEGSTSKAENVNAAIELARGEIVAIFDADHHPAPGAFHGAWRWLANGYDVVQGRCAVRPSAGRARRSFLETVITAEFEQIYTVSHPGRNRIQGFGIFGGSNGYWRAEAIHNVQLDPTMLTEDIDASVRLLRNGGRIITDPDIISAELAPPSLRALCQQRARWSQGWFQVARKHLGDFVHDQNLSVRERIGAAWLFGTCAVMPWVSALTLPIGVYHFVFRAAVERPELQERIGLVGQYAVAVPGGARAPFIGWLLTFGTISFLTQAVVAFRHAIPTSRRAVIFVPYVLASMICFSMLRTAVARTSHIRELTGHHDWKVTPRTSAVVSAAEATS
jgi:cellulose synthase/poly-beta-1,6-N-acetylglucosamine synthase-like glycosyltransferase